MSLALHLASLWVTKKWRFTAVNADCYFSVGLDITSGFKASLFSLHSSLFLHPYFKVTFS